eukprot:4263160-Heterocapsa_arctica.AAC.1
MDPRWMIYDEDYCHMPPGIAQRNPSPTSPGAINEAAAASHTLCNYLRHGERGRVKPFNEGGWFKCSDIINLTTKKDLPHAAEHRLPFHCRV